MRLWMGMVICTTDPSLMGPTPGENLDFKQEDEE